MILGKIHSNGLVRVKFHPPLLAPGLNQTCFSLFATMKKIIMLCTARNKVYSFFGWSWLISINGNNAKQKWQKPQIYCCYIV